MTAYRFTATVIHPSQFAAVQAALTEALSRRAQPLAEREQRLIRERVKVIDNGITEARRMLEAVGDAGRQSAGQSVAELVDLEVRLSGEKADLLNREVGSTVFVLRTFGAGSRASDKGLLKVSLAAMFLSIFCAGLYVAVRETDVYIRKRKRGAARYDSIFYQGCVSHN